MLQVPVLIYELIATEIWKEKVFPEILNLQLEQELLFPIYIVVGILTCFFYMKQQLLMQRILRCRKRYELEEIIILPASKPL